MIDEKVTEEMHADEQLTHSETITAERDTSEGDAAISDTSAIETDYEKLIEEDLAALVAEFPELQGIRCVTDLDNPIRYAALRDLGLSPREAYLATCARRIFRDNRSHLKGTVPRAASLPRGTISETELNEARRIFPDLSDMDIRKLYRKVSK